jgi:hypothetical protein
LKLRLRVILSPRKKAQPKSLLAACGRAEPFLTSGGEAEAMALIEAKVESNLSAGKKAQPESLRAACGRAEPFLTSGGEAVAMALIEYQVESNC